MVDVFQVMVVEQSACKVSPPFGVSRIGVTGVILNTALEASVLQVFWVSDTRTFAVVETALGKVHK